MSEAIFLPQAKDFERSNLWAWMKELGLGKVKDFHKWSCKNRELFWSEAIRKLGIRFQTPPTRSLAWNRELATTEHLIGAKLSIVDSCFLASPTKLALVDEREDGRLRSWTYGELYEASCKVANSLSSKLKLKVGDAVAIQIPMTAEAVAIYLGTIMAGCRVVSIADSFAPAEITTRLRIANAKAIFTQDFLLRGGKEISLFDKVQIATASTDIATVLITLSDETKPVLGARDILWKNFIEGASEKFTSVTTSPEAITNILFSSGTTGDPKAIGWTQSTPIKCAVDAYLHHDLHSDDVVCWPTNLGWMMGPWLLFASFLNQATVALFDGAPHSPAFAKFLERHQVTMLGVVPSLVKAWRSADVFKGVDLSSIRSFSSTGECSSPSDMVWLSKQAGSKPIIEYCGGTEIGGGYLSSTRIQDNYASCFSTKCFGLDFTLLNADLKPTKNGELFLVPPSLGLSDSLLNRNHFEVYFEGTPTLINGDRLRRHGDEVEELENGYFRAHGRSDDTMNLGGIKVSSAEIERTVNHLNFVKDSAAIAINPKDGGPSQLVLALVLDSSKSPRDILEISKLAQNKIREGLNPLFKVHDIWALETLPRTASNKIMRRVLRSDYLAQKAAATS